MTKVEIDKIELLFYRITICLLFVVLACTGIYCMMQGCKLP